MGKPIDLDSNSSRFWAATQPLPKAEHEKRLSYDTSNEKATRIDAADFRMLEESHGPTEFRIN